MNEIKGTYQAAIHPDRINIWYEPLSRRHTVPDPYFDFDQNGGKPSTIPTQFKNNYHNGKISKVALKKITRAVNYLVYLVPRRKYFTTADGRAGNYFLSFITLTLSSKQIHSDNEIKSSILEPFLNEMRQRWKVNNYIWRAEKQENGNLHFHIVSDRFIWWNDIRNSWNFYQERLGYVTRYRDTQKAFHSEGFKYRPELSKKWSRDRQVKAYQDGIRSDWNSPNSSDVHSLKTITSVGAYLCKYITKSDQAQDITGRLWGCSYELTNLKGSLEYVDGRIHDEVDRLMEFNKKNVYISEYYTVVFFTRDILIALRCVDILESFDNYLRDKFPDYRKPDLWQASAA